MKVITTVILIGISNIALSQISKDFQSQYQTLLNDSNFINLVDSISTDKPSDCLVLNEDSGTLELFFKGHQLIYLKETSSGESCSTIQFQIVKSKRKGLKGRAYISIKSKRIGKSIHIEDFVIDFKIKNLKNGQFKLQKFKSEGRYIIGHTL